MTLQQSLVHQVLQKLTTVLMHLRKIPGVVDTNTVIILRKVI